MRFNQFKPRLFEALKTSVTADNLEGLKDVIARRIRELPDDETTAKALQEIEDMLQHLGHGGRLGSIGKEVLSIEDESVRDAKKVLSRLVLSIMEEVGATSAQKNEFFDLWKKDSIVNVDALLSHEKIDFATAFNGYGKNPVITEFVNEVMDISELGMGKGEFGLNVLSKNISVSRSSKKDSEESGSKKGDLQIKSGNQIYQVELKTEKGGAARFGDQEVRPAEGFEKAAMALNTYVKKHKMYDQLSSKLSGSGMNLNQVIEFHQIIPLRDKKRFLGLVRNCLSLIFGNIKGGRTEHLLRLKKNVNEIMSAIEVGNNGGAAQAYSQASFNFYMSRKHDDGVLYTNLNNKTFVYYDDAAQLLAQGLRFHASTPYISATKDPVRSVYPQVSVQSTTFGASAAQAGLKKISKSKRASLQTDFETKVANAMRPLIITRGIRDERTIQGIIKNATAMIRQGIPNDQIIGKLEQLYPKLAVKTAVPPRPAVVPPAPPPPPPPSKPQTMVPAAI